MKKRPLLLLDATINLALGAILIVFPATVVDLMGVPTSDAAFYPSILGAVLFGIGIALLVEVRNGGGLGLSGAVSINLCGGIVLAFWLLFGRLQIPLRGFVFLWCLVAILLGISVVERLHASS